MAGLHVDEDTVRIRLSTVERLLSLHREDIELPRSEIAHVETSAQITSELRGWRSPGTGIPGLVAIGTWRGKSDGRAFRDFALIHRRGKGVVISLRAGRYARVLLSTDDPDAMVAALRG